MTTFLYCIEEALRAASHPPYSNKISISASASPFPPEGRFFVATRRIFSHKTLKLAMAFRKSQSLPLQTACGRVSTLSVRTRWSESTTTLNERTVATMEDKAVDDEIMNMMTIWSLAACWTDDPPRMAPVIIPGMAMIPSTLILGW